MSLLVTLTWIVLLLTACGQSPDPVRLAAQDYRFVPQTIQVVADRPIQLTIVNEGRELHEFTTRLFSDPQVIITAVEHPGGQSPTRVLYINPGKSAKLTFFAPTGTYSFQCRIRGHQGMRGMILVREKP